MTKRQPLPQVNHCEFKLWHIFAQADEDSEFRYLFAPAGSGNYFLNCAFPKDSEKKLTPQAFQRAKQFFDKKGCLGYVRDYHEISTGPDLYKLKWFYCPSGGQNTPAPDLTAETLGIDSLDEFAAAIKTCFNYPATFSSGFVARMKIASEQLTSKFLKFYHDTRPVGYASLFETIDGTQALMNLCVFPDLRNKGYGHRILNKITSTASDDVYFLTENEHLIYHVTPKTDFKVSGPIWFTKL